MKRRLVNALTPRNSVGSENAHTVNRRSVYSCYVGGTEGICSVCSLPKLSCNCQHCRGCGVFILALISRHHCRMCWRPFCQKCSNKTRVVEFVEEVQSQPARVCRTCAVPQGLLRVFGVCHTYEALRQVEAAASEIGDSSWNGSTTHSRRFRWGLYALVSVVDPPRRCTNPSCSRELSYDEVCLKCKVPTVTCALHAVRTVTGVTGSGPNKVDLSVVKAIEDVVACRHSSLVGSLAASDVEDLYNALLPNRSHSFALHGLSENPWAAHKVLLSRVAATLAVEGGNYPNISLAMMDTAEAQLLRVVRVERSYVVCESPGRVRYISFFPVSGRKALDDRLSLTVLNRQVWATGDTRQMGVITPDERTARLKGGERLLHEFGATESLLRELEESPAYATLTSEVLSTMHEGTDVVLCGFSTGGSIASLLTAFLLIQHTDIAYDRLLCVTYGAPLVANRGLTELLQSCPRGDLCHSFVHIVNGSDVVPRLSFLTTFLSAGTLGMASSADHGLSEDCTNMAELRDHILTWLHHIRAAPKKGGGAEKKPSPKEKRAPAPEVGPNVTAPSFSNVTSVYYGGGSDNSSDNGSGDSGGGERGHADDPLAATGDILAHIREPFHNNRDSMQTIVSASGEVSSPLLLQHDISAFEANSYRDSQVLEPFGCYHILWCGQDMYSYSDNPSKTLALLSHRSSMRVLLQDHLMSAYNKALVEYMHAATSKGV